MYEIKCRQCRNLIIKDEPNESRILNAHGTPLEEKLAQCQFHSTQDIVFLNEELLPQWILEKIEEVQWTKCRLNCPNCENRIGAVDYVSGNNCECKVNSLPPVHIIKSKVDLIKMKR